MGNAPALSLALLRPSTTPSMNRPELVAGLEVLRRLAAARGLPEATASYSGLALFALCKDGGR